MLKKKLQQRKRRCARHSEVSAVTADGLGKTLKVLATVPHSWRADVSAKRGSSCGSGDEPFLQAEQRTDPTQEVESTHRV